MARTDDNWTASGGFPAADLVHELSGASVAIHTVLVAEYGTYYFSARSSNPLADIEFSNWSTPVSAITERGTADDSVSSTPLVSAFRSVESAEAVTLIIERPVLDFRTIWWYEVIASREALPETEVFTTLVRNPAERGEGQITEGSRTFTVPGAGWTVDEHAGRLLYIHRGLITNGQVEFPLANEIQSNTADTITILGDPFRTPADTEPPYDTDDRTFEYLISTEPISGAWLQTPSDILHQSTHLASVELPGGGRSVPLEIRITIDVPSDAHIKVRALNYWGNSPWSDELEVEQEAPPHPGSPTQLSLTVGDTPDTFDNVTGSWMSVVGAAGFQYQWRTLNIDASIDTDWPDLWAETTATTVIQENSDTGRVHEFRVRSTNVAGVSQSISDSIVGPSSFGATPPDAPQLSLTRLDSASFRAVIIAVTGATAYQYRFQADSAPEETDPWETTTELTHEFTVNSPGSTYYFEVRALSEDGISDSLTQTISLSLTGTQPPPTGLRLTELSTTSYRANWTAAPGATSYEFDEGSAIYGVAATWQNIGNVTSRTISGVPVGSFRSFLLRAIGPNSVSDSVSATINLSEPFVPPPTQAPGVPRNVSVSITWDLGAFSPGPVVIDWDPPSTGGSVTRYRLRIGSYTGATSTVSRFTYNTYGASVGESLCWSVRAENSVGNSAYSSPGCGTVPSPS